MLARRLLALVAVVFSVARCAEQPTAIQPPATPAFVRWAGSVKPQFSASSVLPRRDGRGLFQTPPISLDQYSVSFWAVRGESRSVRINYMDAQGGNEHPFLVLTTTDPVFVPGVGELAVGDSALLTVTIDTVNLGVSLEPTGLQFGEPAQLTISYGGANGDLNGDGMVDSVDTYVEHQLLGVWYREGESPWSPIPANHSFENKSFTTALPHFSEYLLGFVEALMDWATSW